MSKKPIISVIAAIGKNRELGKRGSEKLLWYIPEDFTHFKNTTLGKPVIMGSSTFESIDKPLPGRDNIVLTHDDNYAPEGVKIAKSFTEAITLAKEAQIDEIFFIGGGFVYEEVFKLDLVDRIYLTKIDASFPEADIFFPDYRQFGFNKIISNKQSGDKNYDYSFLLIEKSVKI